MVNIDRINELAKKARTEGLTDAEKEERAILRREYLDSIKASLTAQLDNTYIVGEDGVKRKVQKKDDKGEL